MSTDILVWIRISSSAKKPDYGEKRNLNCLFLDLIKWLQFCRTVIELFVPYLQNMVVFIAILLPVFWI
jgi:hypothetical protein